MTNENTSDESDLFTVEKILAKKLGRNGKPKYLIKWLGYPDAECTWEPLANLGNDMVKEFETELKEKNKEKRRSKLEKSLVRRNSVGSSRKNSTDDETASDSRDSVDNAYGFDKGLEPETIIGATDANGSLEFLIKWRNCDDRELVPAKVANARCPQMVIRFYEQHFEWKTDGL